MRVVLYAHHKRGEAASLDYFVPDNDLLSALKLAAPRGVDVRILPPNKADHLLVYLSSFSFIAETEPAGVKFYRYEPGFMHQKAVLVDDDFAAVGTANFDNRSFRLNFEITIAVADKDFAAEAEKMLSRDFEQSRQVTADELHQRSFWFRFAVQSSRLMAPIQ
jgi:cardiolipin synthase